MRADLTLPERPTILIITLRRLGDVLLTTPLVRSLRRAFPTARIDMLVFAGTEGILKDNPDIDGVATIPPRAGVRAVLALVRRLGRRYDLAVTTQTGDRPTLLAVLAARRRIGFLPASGEGRWWKRHALHHGIATDPKNHRVVELLRLATCLGIEPHAEVVAAEAVSASRAPLMPRKRYAVVHANPMFRYRRWTPQAWRALALALAARGMKVVATGSADADERAYLDSLWGNADTPIERLDGRLDWPQLAVLLKGAALYVGTDTSVTHLAAAAGCPTVALFGPTDPRLWGPWPEGGLSEMWDAAGRIQRRGNVWLVQHALPCTPCQREGCERRRDSHAACLDDLSAAQVLVAVDQAMAAPAAEAPARTVGMRA